MLVIRATQRGFARHILSFELGDTRRSTKRRYCLLLVVEYVKQIQYTHHLERSDGKRRWVEQLDAAPAFFSRRQESHQETNPARINHGHFRQIDHYFMAAGTEDLFYSLAQAIHGLPHPERAAQLNYVYL